VYAGVDPANTGEALLEIGREVLTARQPITADELERAKAVTRTRVQLRMEDTRSVSGLFGSQAILGLPFMTADESLERSAAVTIDDVERVAGRVFDLSRTRLALVGPFADVRALADQVLPGAAVVEGAL
jgi:predicted Zn-dependent peptidase